MPPPPPKMMLWLLAAVGLDLDRMGEAPLDLSHAVDGWEGVRLRRLCGATRAEDETWKGRDFDKGIKEATWRDAEARGSYGDEDNEEDNDNVGDDDDDDDEEVQVGGD